MALHEAYLSRAREFLGVENPRVEETLFGYAIIKGNWAPSRSVQVVRLLNHMEGFMPSFYNLDLRGRVLHERILVIERSIPIRSHEETDQEVVENIGGSDIHIRYRHKGDMGRGDMSIKTARINPGNTSQSVQGPDRFFHGFFVEETGLLYVAKALKPEYVEGDSFRVPENTFVD